MNESTGLLQQIPSGVCDLVHHHLHAFPQSKRYHISTTHSQILAATQANLRVAETTDLTRGAAPRAFSSLPHMFMLLLMADLFLTDALQMRCQWLGVDPSLLGGGQPNSGYLGVEWAGEKAGVSRDRRWPVDPCWSCRRCGRNVGVRTAESMMRDRVHCDNILFGL